MDYDFKKRFFKITTIINAVIISLFILLFSVSAVNSSLKNTNIRKLEPEIVSVTNPDETQRETKKNPEEYTVALSHETNPTRPPTFPDEEESKKASEKNTSSNKKTTKSKSSSSKNSKTINENSSSSNSYSSYDHSSNSYSDNNSSSLKSSKSSEPDDSIIIGSLFD